ncbi:hypothetical protein [Bacillus sp. NEB1478]|uniref:hypothetical protein n=1 Tax=Bacillus sp. NEB1478 TaxID=3073816 RepID=UPI002873B72F|nr:hypothetical protein [Bacillus sp. NEB1478]WNB90897.1 hypothetical protein RGB74_13365 [Bacillus sp. NEB1478]
MEKELAISIITLMDKWQEKPSAKYDVQKFRLTDNQLPDFHQWTKEKTVLAAFSVSIPEENGYYFLFIDWHRNDNFYLVIYTHNKSTTVAEIQRTSTIDEIPQLIWTYNPLKRDGKNDIRKSYFKQTFGSLTVHIPIPQKPKDVERFAADLFKLSHNRMRADKAHEIFNL